MSTQSAGEPTFAMASSRVFTFLTMFLSIVLLIAGTFEFIPAWILRDPAVSIHLWHIAELTALAAILLCGVMFAKPVGCSRSSLERCTS